MGTDVGKWINAVVGAGGIALLIAFFLTFLEGIGSKVTRLER